MKGGDRRRARLATTRKAAADGERRSLESRERHGIIPLTAEDKQRLDILRAPSVRGRGAPTVLDGFHVQQAVEYWWGRERPDKQVSDRRDSVVEREVAERWGVSAETVRKYRRKHKARALETVRAYREIVARDPTGASTQAIDANAAFWSDAFRKLDEHWPEDQEQRFAEITFATRAK